MTNDDLKQIGNLLDERLKETEEKINGRFDETLGGVEKRFDQRLTGTEAGINGKLRQTEERLDKRISAAEQKLDERISSTEERLDKRISAAEEKLRGELKQLSVDIGELLDVGILPQFAEMADKSDIERLERKIDFAMDKILDHGHRIQDIESVPVVAHQIKKKNPESSRAGEGNKV